MLIEAAYGQNEQVGDTATVDRERCQLQRSLLYSRMQQLVYDPALRVVASQSLRAKVRGNEECAEHSVRLLDPMRGRSSTYVMYPSAGVCVNVVD